MGKHEPCDPTNPIENIPKVNELPVDDTVTNSDAAFVKDFQPTTPSIVTNPVAKCTESCPLSTIEYRGVTSMRQRRPLPPRFFGSYE